jgi:branched-chain amino acid transport system substrate-binding protein
MQLLTGVRRLATFAVVALVTYGIAPVGAETLGPVTDDIGVVKIPKGAPIIIGGYWTLSGPDTALGLDQKRAVEIAFDDRNNEVAGHPIRFIAEDGQCNAEGGQTAATKLASNQQMVVVVGPDCSSSATPGAPILWKAGIPSVATSTTAPSLTAPDRKEGYFGYLRTVYNDLSQGSADAEYLAVAPTDVDMRPLLTGIATSKPCAIYFPIFVAAAAQIARQAPEISGLEDSNIVGGSALMAPGFLEAAGDAAVGFRFTNPDTSTDAFGKRYPEFVEKYKAKFGEAPIQAFHANAYDGGAITLMAIEKVAKKDDVGNTYIGRKALRDALFATAGYDGIGGEITCNEHGDCAGFKFAVYEFTDGDASTFKIGENPKKIFP